MDVLLDQLHIDEGLLCVEGRGKQEGKAHGSGKRSKDELNHVSPFENARRGPPSEVDRDAVDLLHDRGEWYLVSISDGGCWRPPFLILVHGVAEPGAVLVKLKGQAEEELLRSCHGMMAEDQPEELAMSWGIPEGSGSEVLQVKVKVLKELLPCAQGSQPHEAQH